MSGCYDCGKGYGTVGFPDLIIETWAWLRISPTGNEGGLLCPSCILVRLDIEGIECAGYFASGPLVQHHEPAWALKERLLNLEQLVELRS